MQRLESELEKCTADRAARDRRVSRFPGQEGAKPPPDRSGCWAAARCPGPEETGTKLNHRHDLTSLTSNVTTTSAELTSDGIAAQAKWLRRLTRSLVVQEDRADDVLQETLLVALQHQGRPVRSIRPWLARVAFNFARKLSTEDGRRRELQWDCAAERSVPSPCTVLARAEMQHVLSEAVLSLDEPYRSTILLRFLDELSCAEMARHMRVPVETVRTRVKRGLKQLRAKLDLDRGSCRAWAVPILGVTGFERLAPSGGAGAAVLGSIVLVGSMGKFSVAMSVAVLAVLSWMFWPDTTGGDLHPDSARAPTELAAGGAMRTRVAEQREPVAADPVAGSKPATTGSLLVRVVYADDESPAPGVGLRVGHRSDRDSPFGAQRVRTDEDGIARVAGLRLGEVMVETDRDLVPTHRAEISAGSETELTIALKTGVDVSGIVVNRDDVGIAGAAIIVGNWAIPHRKLQPVTTTGTDGRFVIRAANPDHRVSAIAAGYAPSPQYGLRGRRNGKFTLRLVLTVPGGAVRGRVEGPEGETVAGAVLRFGSEKMNRSMIVLPNGASGMERLPVEVRTNEDGIFHVDCLAPGDNPVAVRADGLAPWSGVCQVVAHGETPLVVRLSRGVVCNGTVSDHAGQPLSGVEVRSGEVAALAYLRTRTAADGSYRLAELPPGEVELVADGGKRGMQWTKIQGMDGETLRWDVRFKSDVVLHGRVLSLQGDPVAGAAVGISTMLKEGVPRRPMSTVRTDREGRFSYPTCPEDGVAVWFLKQGYSQAHRTGVKPGDGEVVLWVEKFGEPSVRIKGKVVDPQGNPVGNATVSGTRRKWRLSSPEPVDGSTGEFVLGPMPPDWHRVSVRATGYATYITTERQLNANETWDLGTIRLQRGGRAKVHLDRAKVGDAATAIGVVDSDQRWYSNFRTPGKVAYTQRVVPGRYHLVVSGDEVATQSIPFVVKDGEDTEIHITLSRGWRCDLRVLTNADTVRVTITGEHGLVRDERISRRKEGPLTTGTYLAPGRYTVTAQTGSGEKGKVEFAVERDKTTVIDVPMR